MKYTFMVELSIEDDTQEKAIKSLMSILDEKLDPKIAKISPVCKVQMAHDLMYSAVETIKQDDLPIDSDSLCGLIAACNTLCWVLGHDNPNFSNTIKQVNEFMSLQGYDMDIKPEARHVNL